MNVFVRYDEKCTQQIHIENNEIVINVTLRYTKFLCRRMCAWKIIFFKKKRKCAFWAVHIKLFFFSFKFHIGHNIVLLKPKNVNTEILWLKKNAIYKMEIFKQNGHATIIVNLIFDSGKTMIRTRILLGVIICVGDYCVLIKWKLIRNRKIIEKPFIVWNMHD